MTIRRNADGQQNLADLRKELTKRADVSVHKQGSSWTMSKYLSGFWHEFNLPYWYSERQAIQRALFGRVESPEEAIGLISHKT
jgi:hypothetical protein